MRSLRPLLLALGVAVLAAFGTDYLLQRRARANARDGAAAVATPPAPQPTASAAAPAATPAAAPPTAASPPRVVPPLAVGQRAVSVALRDGAADDLLQPGVRVDVLATLDVQEANGVRRSVTRVIAERVVVLAVQGRDGERAGRRTSVSLAVAPDAANAIELAAAKGTIGFAVRAPQDDAEAGAAAATLQGLAGAATPDAPAPAAATPAPAANAPAPLWEIQVIRGSAAARESVDAKR